MATIEFRFRDYKDPNQRGTWMLVNGKQVMRISARHLSRTEIERYRRQYILTQKGYIKMNSKTYRKKISDDQIKEVREGDLNIEITDIEKDPQTGKWTKEGSANREYSDPEEPIDESKV